MRICVIGLRGIPDVIGGIETHCQNLYPRLAGLADDLEITVIARSRYARSGMYKGVRVRALWAPPWKGVETLVHTAVALLYARLFLHPHVVHLHGVGPGLFAPLSRLLGFRTVATHHAADYERPKWGPFARRVLLTGERLLAGFADEIVCVNENIACMLSRRYPRTRARAQVIRNGAPPRDSAAAADRSVLARFGLRPGDYILAVGRLEPTKGFHDLIEAFQQARPKGRKLVIVGSTLGDKGYSQALLHQQSKDIVFTGCQSPGTLQLLYENCALFVLPSSLEGSPLVVLEALAAGSPIALSDAPANLEFGLEPHHYFRVGDTAALAALLGRNDYDAQRPKQAAAILREHDWDEIARKHLLVFRRVLCTSAAPVLRPAPAPSVRQAQVAPRRRREQSPANIAQ